jgi:hypothetical protein
MKLFTRKTRLQRLLETATDALEPSSGIRKLSLPGGVGSDRALKPAVLKDKAAKAGLIAGGVAGLTAGSAGISSLRRRKEGARTDS